MSPAQSRSGGDWIRQYMVWLRRRLKRRPDTEHEMMLNRLAIVSVGLGYLGIASFYGSADASEAFSHGIVLCTGYAVCSVLLLIHIFYEPGISHARRITALLLDMFVLSMGMHLGDSAFALGYPIYLWIIFGNGFRFGVSYLAMSAAVAVVGFACVIATTPIWLRDIDLAVGLIAGLVFLPAYVAALIRKLSEAKRQAEEASKAKSMFLASVSHELRTPLNAIITLSDLLGEVQTHREPREMVDTIGASGRSLLKLINNILDLSRIEADRSLHQIGEFNLHATIAQTRRVLLVQAQAKQLDLGVWIGPDVPVLVQGAEQDLEEILINLVGNAIKFTTNGGVWLRVDMAEPSETGQRLNIEVRDTGIGIAAEAQERIFESFVQADASIIDRFGGTGLGLSIVKQLVARNGGAISVASAPGEGSTFSLTFAIEPASNRALRKPAVWPAILISRNLALDAQLQVCGVTVKRIATPDGLPEMLRGWDRSRTRPAIIVDGDTMGERDFTRLGSWSRMLLADAVVGVMSVGAERRPQLDNLPFALALQYPPADDQLAAMAHLCTPFEAPGPVGLASSLCARPLRILVAEDNVTNQKVISKLLERDEHDVVIVANGEQAVEALTKSEFDLVLMDINMPVMNGLDATRLHRFASLGRPRTPIYALTADVTPDTRASCADAGMDGCLHKPIEQAELQSVLISIGGERHPAPGLAAPAEPAVLPAAADAPLDLAEVPLADEGTLANLLELGGHGFVADLLGQFASDALGQIGQIGIAVEQLDSASFRDIAHSLRSSAANVGARRMFALCLEWRNATTEELVSDGDRRVAQLLQLLEATQVEIGMWLQAHADPEGPPLLKAG